MTVCATAPRVALSRLGTTPPDGLERWFAAQGAPARCDLARSGAEPLSVAELIATAGHGAAAELLGLSLDYGDPLGSVRLREAIVDCGAARCVDEVLVTTGAAEALLLAAAVLVDPGDRVRVAIPAYEGLVRTMAAAGAVIEAVDVWQPPATALDAGGLLAGARCRAVVVNSPHNPTGLVWPAPVLDSLAAHQAAHGGHLLVDEVARGSLDLSARSAVSLSGFASGAVIAVGDVSKAYGVGGLRIGWLTCADVSLIRRAAALKDLTSLGPSAPSELLAALAIEHRDRLLQRVADGARANRSMLARWVSECDGAWCVMPDDGLVAFPRPGTGIDDSALAHRLRSEHQVGVVPGSLFGRGGHIRVGLGASPHRFTAALEAADAVLRSMRARGRRRAA